MEPSASDTEIPPTTVPAPLLIPLQMRLYQSLLAPMFVTIRPPASHGTAPVEQSGSPEPRKFTIIERLTEAPPPNIGVAFGFHCGDPGYQPFDGNPSSLRKSAMPATNAACTLPVNINVVRNVNAACIAAWITRLTSFFRELKKPKPLGST